MSKIYKIAMATMLASTMAACSDSGGSPEPVVEPPVVEPPVVVPPKAEVASSLQVMYGKITNNDFKPLADVAINVILQNSDKETLVTLSSSSDGDGNYQLLLPEFTGEKLSRAIVSFSKEGFTYGEKAVDIAENQIALAIDGVITQIVSVTIKRADLDKLAFSAEGTPKIQLSLVKSKDGKQRILVGGASAAEGEETQIGLSLPSSSLPESIEVINGELAYFDSSNAADIQSFPGEFIGVGETEQQGQGVSFLREDESDEYRLISSTFSQIKLTDQDGSAIKLSDVQAADGTSPAVTMRVPKGSYSTIEKDFDLSIDGIQIPIFVYKSGDGWQYVGNGLLVDGASKPVGPTYPEDNPVLVSDSGQLNLSTYSKQLYVSVEIVKANQWLKWINLDWPIKVADEITTVCFNGTAKYKGGEAFSGGANVRLPDGGYEWLNISDGKLSLTASFTVSAEQVSNPDNWQFSIRNSKTAENEVIGLPATIETGSTCNDIAVELLNPHQCVISGSLYESDGTTLTLNQVVTTLANSRSMFTSTDGSYSMSVACDKEFTVSALGQTKVHTIAAAAKTLQVDFIKANQAPILGLSSNGITKLNVDEILTIKWLTSDADNDPVTVEVASCSSGASQCKVTPADSGATLSFSVPGKYLITVQANDGNHTISRELFIDVLKIGNKAPKVSGFELNGQFYDVGADIALVVGQVATLKVLATDPNADDLSYLWQGISCDAAECNLDISEAGSYPISLVISDNNAQEPLTTTVALTLTYTVDMPPIVSLVLSASAVSEVNGMNDEKIDVLLQAEDDRTDKDQLTVSWSLMLKEQDLTSVLQLATDNVFSVTIPAATLAIGEYQLTAMVTDKNVEEELGQVSSVSETILVTDDLPPTITLLASAAQVYATAGGSEQAITVTASVADDKTLAEELSLQWSITPVIAYTVSDDGLTMTIPADALMAAEYTITSTVTDNKLQAASSSTNISVLIDNPPVISSMTATPSTQKASVLGTNPLAISVLLAVSDDVTTVPTVEWTVTPNIKFESSATELTISADSISLGEYIAEATVTDQRGQISKKTVAINITKREGNVDIIID